MGNAALRDIATIKETPLSHYNGKTVAVDAHYWLHRYMRATARWMDKDYYTTSDDDEVLNLIVVLRGLPTLLIEDITPVFVFDGDPDDRKEEEIAKRRAAHEQASSKLQQAQEVSDNEAIKRYLARTQKLTPLVQQTTRELLDLLGVPYVESAGAGEAHAATLARENLADAVLSGDYDALLFGSPRTIRSTSDGYETMYLDETLEDTNLSQQQLVDLALLCGTDYNDGVYGIGPKRALKYLSGGNRAEDVLKSKDAQIEGLNELRSLFLDHPIGELPSTPPMLSPPDYDAVREYTIEQWELPKDNVKSELSRFPQQTT